MGNWLKIENLNLPPCRWVRQLQEEFFQQGTQERAGPATLTLSNSSNSPM